MFKNKLLTLPLFAIAGLFSGSLMAENPAFVTNGNDHGPGSLRAAFLSGANKISIRPAVGDIRIDSVLEYAGDGPLQLIGNNKKIISNGDFNVLQVTNAESVYIENLTLQGPGDFDFDNIGIGLGLLLYIGPEKTGTVKLDMKGVTILDVGYRAIQVTDCVDLSTCGPGGTERGFGSPASIFVNLDNVSVGNSGFGFADGDAVRIDERGPGGIVFQAKNSYFGNLGGAAIELNEDDDGDVFVDVRRVTMESTGSYCLASPISVDNLCTTEVNGELTRALDDGFEIFEAGNGSVLGRLTDLMSDSNVASGYDINESGLGGVQLSMFKLEAKRNESTGVSIISKDDGDMVIDMKRMDVSGNSGTGIELRAKDNAQLHLDFRNGGAFANGQQDLRMIQDNADQPGSLTVRGGVTLEFVQLVNVNEI